MLSLRKAGVLLSLAPLLRAWGPKGLRESPTRSQLSSEGREKVCELWGGRGADNRTYAVTVTLSGYLRILYLEH